MDEHVRVVLFQCLRELLINGARHARVDKAQVSIGQHGSFVRVTVSDDGVGFDPGASVATDHGFGLFSIRERLKHLGGRMEIVSAPGQGTRVTLEAPITSEKAKIRRKRKKS